MTGFERIGRPIACPCLALPGSERQPPCRRWHRRCQRGRRAL